MTSEFKLGQKVRILRNTSCHGLGVGAITTVVKIDNCGSTSFYDGYWYINFQDVELLEELSIKSNSKNMGTVNTLVQKFTTKFLPEPQKTFRKLGITDNDNALTVEGKDLLPNYLLKENQDKFKTDVCDDLLKEQEEEKKA